MRFRSAWLVLAGFACLTLTPFARADLLYDIQLGPTFPLGFGGTHISFDLPNFLQHTGPVTSFLVDTSPQGPITAIDLNGALGGNCFIPGFGGGGGGLSGCLALALGAGGGSLTDGAMWTFNAPGTYNDFGNTGSILTITDLSPAGVPEPSSIILLATGLTAVGLVARKKRLHRNQPAIESEDQPSSYMAWSW